MQVIDAAISRNSITSNELTDETFKDVLQDRKLSTTETGRKVMLVLLVLVVGGLLIYGAFMLAEIASSVSPMKP